MPMQPIWIEIATNTHLEIKQKRGTNMGFSTAAETAMGWVVNRPTTGTILPCTEKQAVVSFGLVPIRVRTEKTGTPARSLTNIAICPPAKLKDALTGLPGKTYGGKTISKVNVAYASTRNLV